jgi:hypothetical protein
MPPVYEPFGVEWKREMMKRKKEWLVDYLRRHLMSTAPGSVSINRAMVPLADVLEVLRKRHPASEVAEYWQDIELRSNRYK